MVASSSCRGTTRLLALSAIFLVPAAAPADERAGWKPLFDGNTLTGWRVWIGGQTDAANLVQVHDGLIHLYKDAPAGAEMPFGYFISNEEYSHYHIRFQYKWGAKRFAPRADAKRDSGILYHVVGPDRIWPRSVECQVQEHDTGDIWTVDSTSLTSTFDPDAAELTYRQGGRPGPIVGRRIVKSSTRDSLDGWNSVEVIVRGDSFVHLVNGHVVARGTQMRQPDPAAPSRTISLTRGRIAFQLEGAEVLYRGIEIRELPADAPLPGHLPPRLDEIDTQVVLVPARDGSFLLPAVAAKLTGPAVRIGQDTSVAAHWSGPQDRAAWKIDVARPAKVHVVLTWGVPDDDAGQSFVIELDGKPIVEGKFPTTGSDVQFLEDSFGRIDLPVGRHELLLRPKEKTRRNLADVRSIRLVPGEYSPPKVEPQQQRDRAPGTRINLAPGRSTVAKFDARGLPP